MKGEEKKQEIFIFSANMPFLIKVKYEISLYATKNFNIKVSSCLQPSDIKHTQKRATLKKSKQ